MPCLRHKSLVWAPASDSARMAMICSSVNLLFLMTPPSRRSPIITGSGSGGQVTQLLKATLEYEQTKFCPLVVEVIRVGIDYRKGDVQREEIRQINRIIAHVRFRIHELHDPAFINALPDDDSRDDLKPDLDAHLQRQMRQQFDR